MKYATVINGVIDTVYHQKPEDIETIEVGDDVFAGFVFENGQWIAPPAPQPEPPPVPSSVSRRQAALALLQVGEITDEECRAMTQNSTIPAKFMQVLSMSIPGTNEPMFSERQKTIFIADFSANEYLSDSPLLMLLAYAVGYDDEQIRDMLRYAATQ
jgi:hypothetical protein